MSAGRGLFATAGRLLAYLLLVGVLGWWTYWRYLLLSGSVHDVGGACSSRFHCKDGPCLVHALSAPAASQLVPSDGYCSHGCDTDADCPAPLRCVERPPGLSRKAGDQLPYLKIPARLCLRIAGPPVGGDLP